MQAPQIGASVAVVALAAALFMAYVVSQMPRASVAGDGEDEATFGDYLDATMAGAANALIDGMPVAGLMPSEPLRHMLKSGERLRLRRYELGDGGWTIGYGRFQPYSGTPPPEVITRETAEQWFDEDLEKRGAFWVRKYITRTLQQHEFDALVHMAFNLSPKSFKTIANAVNEGSDPEYFALQFVRAGTNLERGLRVRRAREVALFREGVYHT